MVVFGDSTSDAGRRFNAPASFDFEDIGPFPWMRLFDAPDSDVRENVIGSGIYFLVHVENSPAYRISADTLAFLQPGCRP